MQIAGPCIIIRIGTLPLPVASFIPIPAVAAWSGVVSRKHRKDVTEKIYFFLCHAINEIKDVIKSEFLLRIHFVARRILMES